MDFLFVQKACLPLQTDLIVTSIACVIIQMSRPSTISCGIEPKSPDTAMCGLESLGLETLIRESVVYETFTIFLQVGVG